MENVINVITDGINSTELVNSIAFKLDKESKENFGFENQLISKHGSMVRIETEINKLYLVKSFNKKTDKNEFYYWILENKKANQKSVGHYLKVRNATIITEANGLFESLNFIIS
jgi:hypothetical protein